MNILKGDLSNDLILQGKVVYSARHLSVVILTEIYYKVVLQGVLVFSKAPVLLKGIRIQLAQTGRQSGFLLSGKQAF